VVEQHEKVGLRHAVQVSEPGQEMRLVDRDFHWSCGETTEEPPDYSTGLI
jgi:hypothetical protein